jgi:RNA polymerase sigma-70 factor (ECF subfamily)
MAAQYQESPQELNDHAALERLSGSFRASLLRHFGRRTSNAVDSEDMVQEVFVRLLKRGRISRLENLNAYVFETASSVLKDRFRKDRSHHVDAHDPFDCERHADVDFSPEHVLLDREQLARATAALQELPERTQVIFVLRRLEGVKYQEIAARIGISVSAVEKHMQRATTHLTRSMDQE